MESLSKTIVYANGDMLDMQKTKQSLFFYWQLNEAEKRAFDRLCNRIDLKQKAECEGLLNSLEQPE